MIARYSYGPYIALIIISCMIMAGCTSTKANTTPETHGITLTWDDVPGATSYNIYWSDKKGITRRNGTKISNVHNPHTITGLKKKNTYYFVVTAVNKSGESVESESISHTVDE